MTTDLDLDHLHAVAQAAHERVPARPESQGWHWSGDTSTHTLRLSAWVAGHGRCTVMDFRRWGMQSAQPSFPDTRWMMAPASDFTTYEVGERGLIGPKGATHPSVYRHDVDGIDHPIARHIETFDPATALTLIRRLRDADARALAAEVASRGYREDRLRAERDALAAQIGRVRALHRPTTVEATQGECAAEECAHEDDCPTVPVGVCAECYRIGEDAYPWASEGYVLQHVEYPCPTIRALDEDGGE